MKGNFSYYTPSGHTGEQEQSGPGHRTGDTTTRQNTTSGHTGEQEPSGPGHSTHNTTHRASTPVKRSEETKDTTHATQRTEQTHQ